MSETVNIELKADPSGADEALKKVNKSLKEGTEAAEALSHALDGDVAGAFKSLGELSKTLGIDLGLAFSPAEIIAFAQVVAEVADKLSKLIADTFIYTDAMKEQDKALASANKSLEASAARVKTLGRETQLAAEKSEVGKEKLRLAFRLEDLGGDIPALTAKFNEAKRSWTALQSAINQPTRSAQFAALKQLGFDLEADHMNMGKVREALGQLETAELGYSAALKEAVAETAKTNQTIKAETAKTGQVVGNEQEKEKAGLDAWIAHAMRGHSQLQAAVKKYYQDQAEAGIEADRALAESEEKRIAKINAAEKKAADDAKQTQLIILESAKAHDQAMGQIAEQRLNFELQIGKISQTNYEKQLQWEMAETYANERAKLEAKRQAAEGNLVEQAKVDAELKKLDDKYRAESEKAEQQSLLRRRQQFDQYFKQVSSSFNTALNGWMQGTETASQAFGKMFQDILSQLVNFVEQWIEKKIEMWLMDKLLSQTSQSASAEAQIVSNAAVAYSGAYAATAAIPIVGPGLAPEAAMMAYMDVMAITPAGFALGGIVPATGLALVHEGEKILPKSMSGNGSGLGGITVVVNHSVNAVDAASFQGHIRRHSNMIANEVTRALKRKGAR
jgi:hypothetical protein